DVERLFEQANTAPCTLLEGCLDEPLALTREDDGTVHCLANACTHRANLVVLEAGRHTALRCNYHGRCCRLDGSFVSMPGFDGVEGFPGPDDDLKRVPSGRLDRFLFASVRPAQPFDALLAPLRERVGWILDEGLRFDPTHSRDYLLDAHWALYVEICLEGFHIPCVHPSLAATIDFQSYRTELFEGSNLQLALAADDEPAFDPPPGHPDHGRRIAAWYFWLFPATMLNFYPWGLSLNLIQPLGPARTRIRYLEYVRDAALRGRGAGADTHRVEMEDEAVVARVQAGVRSRFYERGRYSPQHERGVHHFHTLLARALAEA